MSNTPDKADPSQKDCHEPAQPFLKPVANIDALPNPPKAEAYPKYNQRHWLENAGVVFVGLSFLASAAAAAFSGWQTWILSDMERRQLRAYVVPRIEITKFVDDTIVVTPVFKNDGLTQTKNMWASIRTYTSNKMTREYVFPDEATPNTINDPHNRFWLGPHQDVKIDGLSARFTAEDIDNYRKNRGQLALLGIVQYNDVFLDNEIHTIKFCYIFWQSDYVLGKGAWASSQCGGNQNCEDDECKNAR